MIKEINTEKLKDLLKNKDENNIFIDVRTKEEFENKKIDGFINIPLDEIMSGSYQINKNANIYLLCRSGGRSQMAAEIISQNGAENVYNIQGGIMNY